MKQQQLRSLNDQELLALAKVKAKEEQVSMIAVIQIIREVDRRRLYLGLGFGSLHQYVIKELGYEEGSADRRIAAARLTNEIPELEKKISEGKLSLSSLAQARTFFKREEKLTGTKITKDQKWEVLTQLENQSAREAARTLLTISPEQVAFHESQRPVTESLEEWRLIVPTSLKAKLSKLRSLLSHRIPGATQVELVDAIADIALAKLDKALPEETPTSEVPKVTIAKEAEKLNVTERVKPSRYVPAEIKRVIWSRARSRCEFVDKASGRQCESRHKLQIHHETPFGKGGETDARNLKLFCQAHNNFEAIEDYGESKMQFYLPHLRQ